MRTSSRPTTVLGLSLRVARLRPLLSGCLLLVIALLALGGLSRCAARRGAIATFNIENFPRDERQTRGAFAAIEATGASAVAVQEITEPQTFAAEARARLGPSWRFVSDSGARLQHVGVLFDGEVFTLGYARTHDETSLGGTHKPTLEVRLRRVDGGRAARLFVVHLKAGGQEHAPVRARQLVALAGIVGEAARSWDEVLVLGDFNSTTEGDRELLARFARRTGLDWSSRGLACTSYWDRSDGCLGVALDHVFSRRAAATEVGEPCATEGCEMRGRCPAFHREVSDHCPVVLHL